MATRHILTDLDFGEGSRSPASRIINLPDPTASHHAATKAYADALVEGLNWKDNVRAAATGNLNLSSPGSAIDDVNLNPGDSVLVRLQSDLTENGIYIWNGAATAMTRRTDADTFDKLINAVVSVDEGTANATTTWRQTEVGGVIDTDDIVFESFATGAPNASETVAGKVEIATQTQVNNGTETGETGAYLVVTPATLAAHSNRKLKHAADVGDGSNTSYAVTHNFGTRDLQVQLRRNSGNYDYVDCEVRATDTNTVTLLFSSAPTTNQFRVIILG